jgi:crotonobetainyl-CoA:carnitine CoA-transferase CaiB-like acyl-CoA transferase
MVVELEHPRAGRTRALGLPVKLSRTPGKVSRPAPVLGQHTREVLAEFGFSAAEIEALVASGAAVAA